jgi:hypothetical protein
MPRTLLERTTMVLATLAVAAGVHGHGALRVAADDARAEQAPPAALPLVTWDELAKAPERHLGRSVRLRIQFQAPVADWNPWMTRFGTREFDALQAWTDEQFPWSIADFEAPRVRLFYREQSACAWALAGARIHRRYEVQVRVREWFLGEPWCEIEQVLPLSEQISEGTLIHAGRALELTEQRAWELADGEFERALSGNLPPHARAELERLRAALPQKTLR